MNYLVLDTETTNTIEEPIMYDIGWSIYDKNKTLLKTVSFIVAETWNDKELLEQAYFANKLPQYEKDINEGKRVLASIKFIRYALNCDCKAYDVISISAHNLPFDYRSTTKSIRYLTKSDIRYFLPYGVELWCTLAMARDCFGNNRDYEYYCKSNGFCTKNGKPRFTAEVLYGYLTNNPGFEESHTGLEDTLIESTILFECLRINPNCRKSPWKD